MNAAHILVVDDEDDIRATISDILEDEGYAVSVAADAAAARVEVGRERPDLILLDVWMPDVDGITLLREWAREGAPRCPVVILSGHGTVETAVEATRLGAVDFVEKPLSLAKLLRTVQKALDKTPASSRPAPRTLLPRRPPPGGRSALMRALRDQVAAAAKRNEPVLIVGESGSGRTVVARYLHDLAGRGQRPFVELAGGAIPAENAAALLFGGVLNAEHQPGVLEQAAGGALYLRDLQDLCPDAQRLLAGVLEQGSFARLGESVPVPLDLRLIASLTPDDARLVRPDLLAKLTVLELRVPALRDRSEDVPELLRYAVDSLVEGDGLAFRRFGMAAQNRLRHYPWPGNVRELMNLVRRLLVAGGDEEISLAEVERHLVPATGHPEPLVKQDLLSLPLRAAREKFERAYLVQQLALCGGRVGQLAKRVGMERTHLYRKLRALGVDFRQIADED
ncbi:MAG: sigma-54 dependent transcriptional regulator [Gammaproteobacteria bacterium]|nr:sigma-54 dependent transcriptional regulator [Gammaproteobacteria bacterium]